MSKQQSLIVLLASLSVSSACSKGKDNNEHEVPAAAKSSTAKQSPAPFTGELTAQIISSTDNLIRPFDIWTTSFAKLQAKLGAPTLVEGKMHYWAVMAGDKCTYFSVEKDNEANFFKDKPDPRDMVGSISDASTVDKSLSGSWSECIKAAGVKPEDLEDPNAPNPPDDGLTNIEDFQAGIAAAKSKWLGKKLIISGVINGVTTTTATGSDIQTTILSIKTDKDSEASLGCTLVDPTQGEGRMQNSAVKVTGIANDDFRGGLSDCSVVPE